MGTTVLHRTCIYIHTYLTAYSIMDLFPDFGFLGLKGTMGYWKTFYTNNKSIELQLMRKFSEDQAVFNLEFPEEFKGQFQTLLEKLKEDDNSNILHMNRGNVLRL